MLDGGGRKEISVLPPFLPLVTNPKQQQTSKFSVSIFLNCHDSKSMMKVVHCSMPLEVTLHEKAYQQCVPYITWVKLNFFLCIYL